MPTPNIFFALQQRIQALILAADYFDGLDDTSIVTEQVGDLLTYVQQKIIPSSFGVVITTSSGEAMESEYGALLNMEDLNISIISNPTLDKNHNALDAAAAIIAAVHGQPVTDPAPPAGRPFDFFQVTGHLRRRDAPETLHVHELHVKAGARIS